MSKYYHPAQKTVDVTIAIDGVVIGGQKNALLNQSVEYVDISNNIQMEWKEYYPAVKSWNFNCTGLIVNDSNNDNLLQSAFINNDIVTVTINNTNLSGKCTITQLQLVSN